jgi:peptidoglycan/LPS O-acetylase OafA/YrhL
MTALSIKTSSYRAEIQGIRTIGALLVACFHIWGGQVSGGVDVFFVVSGFLITGSLYKEVQRSQTINVLAFWGRIAKRVAPMAYTILALTLLAALLWMPLSRQQGLLTEVLYSAFHLENLNLMMNAVDYLARDEAPSPVQHFWALSVQVQFYAVWPFLLMGAAIAARRLRGGAHVYLVALVVVFLGSLIYSVVQTRLDPSPTYFNTLARVWEFAMGGILAISLPYIQLSERLREIAGWIGLAAVVSCGFVIPAFAQYPGYIALWPTIGAALVILSGGGKTRFGADKILAAKPLVAMGEISFSFYLWHWPILVFALIVTRQKHLGLWDGLAVIAIALCGAYVTARWLEQPIQQSSIGKKKAWHIHVMGAALALPILLIAGLWHLSLEREEVRQQEAMERRAKDYPGGAIPMATASNPRLPIYPAPAAVKRKHANRCQQNEKQAEVRTCIYGLKENPRKVIALVGGSHAEHWLPALEKLAYEQQWHIVAVTKSACPFMPQWKGNPSCAQWNKDVHAVLDKIRPDVVFTTSTRRGPASDRPNEYVPDGYVKQWQRLGENGIKVIAVRNNPKMKAGAIECIETYRNDIRRCGVPFRQQINEVDPTSMLAGKLKTVSFIDLTDRFCDAELCLPVGGNVLVYRDTHHITIEYARTLATPLGERMKQVRPDLFLPDDQPGSEKQQTAGAGE